MAVAAAPDLVLDALLMFGAIGYTWEHDTHLYWRRATSLAASLGPMTRWTREVGELARTLSAPRRSTWATSNPSFGRRSPRRWTRR